MKREVFECPEFGEVPIRMSAVIESGELKLDERIVRRGFLKVVMGQGEITLRADRHVGLIPVNDRVAVRVQPRASIANLSYMLARSGVAPQAISGYSRGYLPRFQSGEAVESIYLQSMVDGCTRILQRGLLKGYNKVADPPPFRGRFLAADTIRKHRARGIRYKAEFSFSTLSTATIENQALKAALHALAASADHPALARTICGFATVPEWPGDLSNLVSALGHRVSRLPPQLNYYRDPLWTAYVILQQLLPDVEGDGSVKLDSLIIDISKVFEAYTRRCLSESEALETWRVVDGNKRPSSFFVDCKEFKVHPDIVIERHGVALAVFDVKYKPQPKESDRYELLSFMDAVGVKIGGFICPSDKGSASKYLGTTADDKSMSVLRFDLAATHPQAEANRLFENVRRVIAGARTFV